MSASLDYRASCKLCCSVLDPHKATDYSGCRAIATDVASCETQRLTTRSGAECGPSSDCSTSMTTLSSFSHAAARC